LNLEELVSEGYLIETSTTYEIAKPFAVTEPLTLDKTLVLPSNWTMDCTGSYPNFYKSNTKPYTMTYVGECKGMSEKHKVKTIIELEANVEDIHEQYLKEQIKNEIELFGHKYLLQQMNYNDGDKICRVKLVLYEDTPYAIPSQENVEN